VSERIPDANDALKPYREKRDFSRTAEPSGETESERRDRLIFCVQKHAASSLHYDLRLEMEGVLKSWAVPKGPSLDPAEKRLAVRVEDHPLDYASFEGTIPEGEYGAGTVLLWDRGWWEPDTAWGMTAAKTAPAKTARSGDTDDGSRSDAAAVSPAESLEHGELKFTLHGEKLKGSFVVVQMKGRGLKNWLLLKHRDEAARPGSEITAERPESVATGRSLEQIRAEEGSGHP
jgi:bifunctional non-homologous end joining protein LigD